MFVTKKKYYDIVNNFCNYDATEKTIELYPEVFYAMCKYHFKLPRRSIDDLFENFGRNNWKRLWETDEEKRQNIDYIAEKLKWEVFYCSDRMSWDRLLRIHWLWQRIKRRKLSS